MGTVDIENDIPAVEKASDEAVYSRFLRSRQSSDFAVLFERHRDKLLLFILGFTHNIEDSEDIMLDSFAVAAAGPTLFSNRSSFKTWLYGIARNKALMHLRKNRFESGMPLDEAPEIADTALLPEARVILTEQKEGLLKALDTLNEDYRNVLYLMYFEDMSHEQVAAILKKNKKQVYNLATRGREKLREVLKDMPEICPV